MGRIVYMGQRHFSIGRIVYMGQGKLWDGLALKYCNLKPGPWLAEFKRTEFSPQRTFLSFK